MPGQSAPSPLSRLERKQVLVACAGRGIAAPIRADIILSEQIEQMHS